MSREGPRIHVPAAGLLKRPGETLALPPAAARHVQVLRLQPQAPLVLFDGSGGEWTATVVSMRGRSEVEVRLVEHRDVEREMHLAVTLATVMPANDRMDDLVEKATELGAVAIHPLMSERSVLRLAGERAQRKREHWQAVAVAACEQCGRNRVPLVAAPLALSDWLAGLGPQPASQRRLLLGLGTSARAWAEQMRDAGPAGEILLLSGPEGGLSAGEEAAAREAGFKATRLGPRILRADTAPLAALAALSLHAAPARPEARE